MSESLHNLVCIPFPRVITISVIVDLRTSEPNLECTENPYHHGSVRSRPGCRLTSKKTFFRQERLETKEEQQLARGKIRFIPPSA